MRQNVEVHGRYVQSGVQWRKTDERQGQQADRGQDRNHNQNQNQKRGQQAGRLLQQTAMSTTGLKQERKATANQTSWA